MTPREQTVPPAVLTLPDDLCRTLIDEAVLAGNREICGFLARADETAGPLSHYVVSNRAPTPASRFDMDAAEQIAVFKTMRERGEQLVAIYHSHPTSPAVPSAHDLAGHSYPAACALIVSPQAAVELRLRAWALNGVEAQPITLVRC